MTRKLLALILGIALISSMLSAFTTFTGMAIVSSTINSTTIGAITPSTGGFTTVSATGEASLQGSDTITSDPLGNGGGLGWKYALNSSGSLTMAVGVATGTEVHRLGNNGNWLSVFGTTDPANNAGVAPDTNAQASLGANGKIQLQGGIQNGTGLQAVNGTTCTTAASANASCSTTVTWSLAFPNTTYKAECQIKDQQSGGAVFVSGTGSRTTTTLVLQIQNAGANTAASSYTYDCLGWE